jgi:hypothetical protein
LYGAVPPLAITVALPVLLPKQSTLTCASNVKANAALGCVIVTGTVMAQPPASVTVQVHVPAGSAVTVAVVRTGVVFHE